MLFFPMVDKQLVFLRVHMIHQLPTNKHANMTHWQKMAVQ